jgi:Zn-dependent protease with chaperone function
MEIVLRAIVLGFAWFAALNVVASTVSAIWGTILLRRRAATARPANILFVRLLPSAGSLIFVVIFLPIQWVLEPRNTVETIGAVWYILALPGAAIMARSAWRAARIAHLSCLIQRHARPWSDVPDIDEVDELPGLSLAGILRPRILVGRKVTTQLTGAELDVAIAHETAHRDAFDNLARWCMLCAPDVLCCSTVSARLEHEWHVTAESRADARAIRGDRIRAVHLASALIKVARLSEDWTRTRPVVAWSTLNDPDLLRRRVRRLVSDVLPVADPPASLGARAVIAVVAIMVALPAVAGPIHRLTEALVAILP